MSVTKAQIIEAAEAAAAMHGMTIEAFVIWMLELEEG